MAGYMAVSKSDDWTTPKEFYDSLNSEFDFNYDPCPVNYEKDGLSTEWGERNFINPPYSEWGKWVKKGVEEWAKGKLCVFLLPARTDTKVFHEIILANKFEVRFIKGRLKFGDMKQSAPFPSMIVVMPCWPNLEAIKYEWDFRHLRRKLFERSLGEGAEARRQAADDQG